ncbi:MAG: hypothetical protein R3A10_04765 [Caldilineaceae bacterium]
MAAMLDVKPETTGRFYHDVLTLDNVTGDDLAAADDLDAFFLDENPLRGRSECLGGRRLATGGHVHADHEWQDGVLLNIVVNVYDITRFREEEEIKSTFTLSIISHELKTPVVHQGLCPDAGARMPTGRETARQGLQVIEEEVDRLEALINNLLDVAAFRQAGCVSISPMSTLRRWQKQRSPQTSVLQTTSHRIETRFPGPAPAGVGR